jgi:D-alanine-D-alanine ligase
LQKEINFVNIAKKIMMKNIAIVCGGYSGEYNISIESAQMVKKNLDKSIFNSYVIIIKQDDWYYVDESGVKNYLNKGNFRLTLPDKEVVFDGVFNAIHGTPGEDGKLLGYLDMLGIPYTSCDMDVSALTFNKYLCNNFVKTLGIKVANSVSFVLGEVINMKEVIETLGLPVFVKPARSGSSVGVSKVVDAEGLSKAINNAFNYDNRILIEETIVGREIDCGLYRSKNELVVLPLTEIITNNDFFDYEAKYTIGKADEITPPINLNIDKETDIKAISSFLYNKLGCTGIVRIDYILTDDRLYFIELNTVPGLSKASIVPKQVEAMGIPISNLFNTLINNMFSA